MLSCPGSHRLNYHTLSGFICHAKITFSQTLMLVFCISDAVHDTLALTKSGGTNGGTKQAYINLFPQHFGHSNFHFYGAA
jgi:hypothetical protein